MISWFKKSKHNNDLYNTLLNLSRNIFFYKNINLKDSFETRIYLMFFHFSIILIIYKKKGKIFNQVSYDNLFHSIENNLRELGLGDVSVNKKMKDLNKILYDILLKIDKSKEIKNEFEINEKIISEYLNQKNQKKVENLKDIMNYFNDFFNFCFELPIDNMLKDLKKFKHYGSS